MALTSPRAMPLPPPRVPARPMAWSRLAGVALTLSATVLALVLGSASGQVGAAEASSGLLVVTAADDGRVVNLRRGEQLQVVLSDIAGTGYTWEIEQNNPKLLAPEGQQVRQDPGPPPPPGQMQVGVVGGPMQVRFLFRAVGQGSGELRLRHWRPWEGPGSVDRRFKLAVRIG